MTPALYTINYVSKLDGKERLGDVTHETEASALDALNNRAPLLGHDRVIRRYIPEVAANALADRAQRMVSELELQVNALSEAIQALKNEKQALEYCLDLRKSVRAATGSDDMADLLTAARATGFAS